MRARRLRGRPGPHSVVSAIPLLALRNTLPVVPAPRADRGGVPWRPVLFGLGAAVGFAVALGRTRRVLAPGVSPGDMATNPSGKPEGGIGRSRRLPAPLTESIEAELAQDGPVLFSPPDAIDPEALETEEDASGRGTGHER